MTNIVNKIYNPKTGWTILKESDYDAIGTVLKRGVLKHDIYSNAALSGGGDSSFGEDLHLTKDDVDNHVRNYRRRFIKIYNKGDVFLCWHYEGDPLVWAPQDDPEETFSEKWAHDHLEKVEIYSNGV